MAFKVSTKLFSAIQRTGAFPAAVSVRFKSRRQRFRRVRCVVSADATRGHATYRGPGRLAVTQAWRLPHDEGIFDDPAASCD